VRKDEQAEHDAGCDDAERDADDETEAELPRDESDEIRR
jgi:hypothetical protein